MYIFKEDYGTAKAGKIVDRKYFNYDDVIIQLLLENHIIEYINHY